MAAGRGRYPSEFKERILQLVRAGVARSGWPVPWRLGILLAFPLVTLACDQASQRAGNTQLVTTTDSAGVIVIESAHPQWSSQHGWTVASEPEFTIGASGLEQQGILFGSITTMEVLSSGRLAVADHQSATVSVFDTTGVFLHSFGGRGQGPGEFDGIWDLFACAADTVMVSFRSELSVFDGQGRFVERMGMSDGVTRLGIEAVYDDCGHFVAAKQSQQPPRGEEGFFSILMVRTDRRLSQHDTLAMQVAGEMYTAPWNGRLFHVPWTPGDSGPQVIGDDVVLGFGRWPEMRVHGADGKLQRVLRWRAERVPVTAADHQRYNDKRTAFIEMYGGVTEALQSFPSLRDFPRVPSYKPAFDRFLVDEMGNIWARQYPAHSLGMEDMRPPFDYGTASAEVWTVIDAGGVWLGQVQLPEGFSLHRLARGRAYGVFSDDYGVQTVQVYPIRRS